MWLILIATVTQTIFCQIQHASNSDLVSEQQRFHPRRIWSDSPSWWSLGAVARFQSATAHPDYLLFKQAQFPNSDLVHEQQRSCRVGEWPNSARWLVF